MRFPLRFSNIPKTVAHYVAQFPAIPTATPTLLTC